LKEYRGAAATHVRADKNYECMDDGKEYYYHDQRYPSVYE